MHVCTCTRVHVCTCRRLRAPYHQAAGRRQHPAAPAPCRPSTRIWAARHAPPRAPCPLHRHPHACAVPRYPPASSERPRAAAPGGPSLQRWRVPHTPPAAGRSPHEGARCAGACERGDAVRQAGGMSAPSPLYAAVSTGRERHKRRGEATWNGSPAWTLPTVSSKSPLSLSRNIELGSSSLGFNDCLGAT